MILKTIGCPKETVCSEKRGLWAGRIPKELGYLMRDYKKDGAAKELEKLKSNNEVVHQ